MFIQQGDVLLDIMEVSELPKGQLISAKNGRYILAEGEVTGHAHALDAVEGITMCQAEDGNTYIRLENDSILKHEEHGHITLKPGVYKIRKVREYDHAAEEARNVVD